MPILKRHVDPATGDGQCATTMIFKSSWGIMPDSRANFHWLLQDYNRGMNRYSVLVDIFGSSQIAGKSLLYLLDGLYAGDKHLSTPYT